ncbi:hypothetical protein PR048_011289 [Dryococelus australis]|uniref:Uncharacterized protein n=1 Tax=Dryococelus australis TaxID=614101 RepID=A0ABQ9HL64_9NEOP|nr:hypothetical protein PR048_011289 [Dryococelus australis]
MYVRDVVGDAKFSSELELADAYSKKFHTLKGKIELLIQLHADVACSVAETLYIISDNYEAILFPLVESCLPLETLLHWERPNSDFDAPLKEQMYSLILIVKREIQLMCYKNPVNGRPTDKDETPLLTLKSDILANNHSLAVNASSKIWSGNRVVLSTGVVAVEILFGLTLMGTVKKLPFVCCSTNFAIILMMATVTTEDVTDLRKLKAIGISDPAEKNRDTKILAALEHFKRTVEFVDGRYQVKLPCAARLFEDYDSMIQERLSLNIIEESEENTKGHYLSHRPVVKETSSTAKVCPVFDGLAKTGRYPSLNDCLEQVPNLIELLPDILLADSYIGIVWHRKCDTLKLNIKWWDKNFREETLMMRNVLSMTQRIFDPICFSIPAALNLKLILQTLWKKKLAWDASLDGDYVNDAIAKAYATCVFLCSETMDGQVVVSLVQAKSHVAALKIETILWLELMGATTGMHLLKLYILAWIQQEEEWSVFVTNHIKEIKELTEVTDWQHISAPLNPADLPSRESWLHESEDLWPMLSYSIIKEEVFNKKLKKISVFLTVPRDHIACMFRFKHHTLHSMEKRIGPLSVDEVKYAEDTALRLVQEETSQSLDESRISMLRPFRDETVPVAFTPATSLHDSQCSGTSDVDAIEISLQRCLRYRHKLREQLRARFHSEYLRSLKEYLQAAIILKRSPCQTRCETASTRWHHRNSDKAAEGERNTLRTNTEANYSDQNP